MLMKKGRGAGLAILMGWFSVCTLGFGQIVENPAKPQAKDAGRVLALKEVWRITDDSGEFYLKSPSELRIADEGSVLLHDSDQLLKFSPEGKFIKSLLKKGQGPGEILDLAFQFRTLGKDIYVFDLNARRSWRANLEGTFQGSISITDINPSALVAAAPEGPVFAGIHSSFTWPPQNDATARALSVPHWIVLVPRNGGPARDIMKWERQVIRGQGSTLWDPMIIALGQDAKTFYMALRWDYGIDVLDATTGKIIKKFARAYPKFRIIWGEEEKRFVRERGMPLPEFWPDINSFYPISNGVWVETSTEDKAKGRLYDVFDKDGRFVDSFYVGAGRMLMAVREGFVFCQEKNEDETITIVKYKIDTNTP
jgi:hypothetical protein